MSVTDARPVGTYALVAFCGTERRFCARFECRLTRRSVRLWSERGRAQTDNLCSAGQSRNGGAFMVERSPSDGTTTRRFTGGAIASLSAAGLLLIFMIQNTDDAKLDFLFWSFTWPL